MNPGLRAAASNLPPDPAVLLRQSRFDLCPKALQLCPPRKPSQTLAAQFCGDNRRPQPELAQGPASKAAKGAAKSRVVRFTYARAQG